MVSDLKTVAYKGCKNVANQLILPYSQDFLVSVLLSALVERCFVSGMRDVLQSNTLDMAKIRNSELSVKNNFCPNFR